MICGRCGRESNSASHVCPYCGQYMGEEHVSSPLKVQSGKPAPAPEQGNKESTRKRRAKKRKPESYYMRRRVINWAWVKLSALVLFFLMLIGGYVFLKVTPTGQVILARMGRKANASALWAVGTEYLDRGDIPKAIATYEKAAELEPTHPDILKHLFDLAEAYEAFERPDLAFDVFTRIAKETKGDEETPRKQRTEAYRNAIRILKSQNKTPEAAALMAEAYEKTHDLSFYKDRSQLVPKPPTASLPGGPYLLTQTVSFESEQGYDIYYTDGEGELPEEGILYKEPIVMTEGVYVFRAVCTSENLMSDEMKVKYTIRLPVPMAPRANVQPGSYNKPFRVKLRNVSKEKDLRYYYTLDGTKPTPNSPEYTGESILVPCGRVTLRAIAVNKYGKSSNEMVMDYRVKGKYKYFFGQDDQFDKFSVMKTTQDAFIGLFGQPTEQKSIEDTAMTGSCTQLTYPWGEARFCQTANGNLLYYITTNDPAMTAPRKTKLGMSVEEIAANYRDMGQPYGPRGDRGLYYKANEVYGAYNVPSDDPLEGSLEYWFVNTQDPTLRGTNTLTYHIKGGKAVRITYAHTDRLLPIVH